MTTVINMFGGPGSGKSTTAAHLFALMKLKGISVELVREYVKNWAWNDRKVSQWDQVYILGKQIAYESTLYGKVDYVVTDSPLLLAGFYQKTYSEGEDTYVDAAAKEFLKHAMREGVNHLNFFLTRAKPFDPNGRWGSEEDAIKVDNLIKSEFEPSADDLSYNNYLSPLTTIGTDVPNEHRAQRILEILGLGAKGG